MTNTAIRHKLHNYLEIADHEKLEAIYTIMENEIEDSSITYTDELKTELSKRHADYLNREVK